MDVVELLPEEKGLKTPKWAKLQRPERSEEVLLGWGRGNLHRRTLRCFLLRLTAFEWPPSADLKPPKPLDRPSDSFCVRFLASRSSLIPNPLGGFGYGCKDVWRNGSKIPPHLHPSTPPSLNEACGVRMKQTTENKPISR